MADMADITIGHDDADLDIEKKENSILTEKLRQVRRAAELEEEKNRIKKINSDDCHHESLNEHRLRNNSAMSFCGDPSCEDPSCKAKTLEMYSSEYEYD